MEKHLDYLVNEKSGWWQRLVLISMTLVVIIIAPQHLAMPFFAPSVDHWCSQPKHLEKLSAKIWKNYSIPVEKTSGSGKKTYSSCDMFNVDYENVSVSDYVPYMMHLKAENESFSDNSCSSWSYDESIWKETIVFDWNLVCDRSVLVSVSSSVYMAGMVFGLLILPHFSDKIGRRPVILFCLVTWFTTGLGIVFSPNYVTFTVLRFFTAAVSEFSIDLAYVIGEKIPESVRWQLSVGRYDEAVKSLKKCAELNNYFLPDDSVLQDDIEQMKRVQESKKSRENENKPTIFDLFKTKEIRIRTLISYFLWFSVSFCYYAFSLNIGDMAGNMFVNMIIGSSLEIVGVFIGSYMLVKFGRKRCLASLMFFAGALLLLAIPIPASISWLKVSISLLGRTCISMVFAMLYIHTGEYMPTVLRAIGIGSCNTCARLGSIIAPYAHQIKELTSETVVFIIYGVLCILCGIAYLRLPETLNCPLPESIEDAENLSSSQKRNCNMEKHLDYLVNEKSGWWQRLVLISMTLVVIIAAPQHLAMPFFAPSVDHWCSQPKHLERLSAKIWKNYSIPVEKTSGSGKKTYSSCDMFNVDYENVSVSDYVPYMMHLKEENESFSDNSCSSWSYDESKWKETIVFDWNLVCDRSVLVSVSSSVYMAGMVFGLLILPHFSDKSADWKLHLSTTEELLHYFHAHDQYNYGRWGPLYVADMLELQLTDLDTWSFLDKGNFVISKRSVPFTAIGPDHAIEQEHKKMKMKRGFIGITGNEQAMEKHVVIAPTISRIVQEFKEYAGIDSRRACSLHHELTSEKSSKLVRNAAKLVGNINMQGNPFLKNDMYNLMTFAVAPDDVSKDIEYRDQHGKEALQHFVSTRMVDNTVEFWGAQKKNKFKYFMDVGVGMSASYYELRIVFDQYIPGTLKETTREKRSLKLAHIHYHVNDDTEIKSIKSFLAHIDTKAELTTYLSHNIISHYQGHRQKVLVMHHTTMLSNCPLSDIVSMPGMSSSRHSLEEGDQLVLLNACDVMHKDPQSFLDVFSVDIDVFVLLTGHYKLIPKSTTLIRRGSDRLSIRESYLQLGQKRADALIG
ncbi:Organic cation transporter protein [Nymphon striatum]|nr:Organic cation transporter protein [Nymphon striatum]